VEVDAQYIKGMLNKSDLYPNTAMNQWIAAILMFDFELVHVPGAKHKGPDGLSRRRVAEREEEGEGVKEVEEWVDEVIDWLWNMGGKLTRERRRDISVSSGKKRGRRRRCHIRKKGEGEQIK